MINCMSNAVECKTLFIRAASFMGALRPPTVAHCLLMCQMFYMIGLLVYTRMVFAFPF
jgi:hypothetical protein